MQDILWSGAVQFPILIPICLTAILFACLCGCRGRERKDELVGIEGHVKIHNLEVAEEEVNGNTADDRYAPTAQRSLPDLPVDNAAPWDPSDTASELYATVGNKPAALSVPAEETTSAPKPHAYDKLRNVEHAYAQVRSEDAAVAGPSGGEIAAAPAVAGRVTASDDLPYMTPPTHFSGDSQDSAKGYTSISVREPLAQLRAETAERPPERHYATVSDDSDDMYAAIDEPQTYARIKPEASADPAVTHSRQESCSSCGSAGLMSSPKPEKREANSPLPAPPADRNLDDMYAKVNKKKRRDLEELHEKGNSTESASSEGVSYRLQSNPSTTDSSMSCPSHPTTTETSQSCPSHNSTESPSSQRRDATDSSLSSDADVAADAASGYSSLDINASPCYESLHNGDHKTEPNYATLNKGEPNYATLGKGVPSDPNYATLGKGVPSDPNYATLGKGVPLDPNYETLGKGVPSDSDPNYETLNKGVPSDCDPNYETLNKGVPSDSDPNYETLNKGPPSDSDPNYERIGHHAVADTDGYATVFHHSETQYEVVRFRTKQSDPPYATLGSEPPYNSLEPRTEPPYSSLVPSGAPHRNSSGDPPYSSLGTVLEPPYQLLANCESGGVDK